MIAKDELKERLKKCGMTFESFSEKIAVHPRTFHNKNEIEDKYINVLELIIENKKLEKKIIEFNSEIVKKLKEIK
jgi:hypothetical protein